MGRSALAGEVEVAHARAKNFRVIGPNVYDLDRDGNGIDCEG